MNTTATSCPTKTFDPLSPSKHHHQQQQLKASLFGFEPSLVPDIAPSAAGTGTTTSPTSQVCSYGNYRMSTDVDLLDLSGGNVSSNNNNYLEALQVRDHTFVENLPQEIIAEQQRILNQIQSGSSDFKGTSTTNGHGNASSNSDYIQQQQQQLCRHRSNNNIDQQLQLRPQIFDLHQQTSWNATVPLPAEVHPLRNQMKQERKTKTAIAATTGAVVGGILCGPAWPIGAAAGAALGGYAGKVTARAGERKLQRRWDKKAFNEYTAKGSADVHSEGVAFA